MEKEKKKRKLTRTQFLLLASLIIYVATIGIDYTGRIDAYKFGWWDYLITTYENRPPNPDIILLTIDSNDTSEIGSWPWPRNKLASLIEFLEKADAKVVVFDFFFRKEIPTEDKDFFRAIKKHGRVVLAQPWNFTSGELEEPPESFKNFGIEMPLLYGHVAMTNEEVYRLLSLFILYPVYDKRKSLSENIDRLSFALLSVKHFRGWDKDAIRQINSGNRKFIALGALKIPVLSTGKDINGIASHMIINYSGPTDHFKKHNQSFATRNILSKKPDNEKLEKIRDAVKGKIVLIYNDSLDPNDLFRTPYTGRSSENDANSREKMPGGEVHAHEIATLLDERFISYDEITDYTIPLLFLLAGVVIFSGPIKWRLRIILFILICIPCPILSILMFKWFLILTSITTTFISLILLFFALIFYERKQFVTYFGQFVSTRLRDEILRDEKRAEVGTKEVEATIVFADIRGFSTLSEKMTPSEVTTMITEYHAEMNKIFEQNRGVILDYLGDAEMIGFGTVGEEKYHALLAIKSGLEMQDEIAGLRKKWGLVGGVVFEVGVGICTGRVAEGIVGSDSKKQLVSMGDTTNTAARIQALSKDLDSLVTISDSTYVQVKDDIESIPLKEMPLKGKTQKVMLHKVIKIKEEALEKLKIE